MLGSLDKNVYALDADTGEVDWTCELAGIQNMASFTAKDGTLYATQYSDGMAAIDVETGEERWRADTSSSGNQAPTVVGDTVVVVSQDSILSTVDAESGRMIDQLMIHDLSEAGMVSSPIVVDGVVFLGTEQDGPYHGWMQEVPNYEATTDFTGEDEVRIDVGAGESGHLFDPPAVLIEPGTEIIWEWTGRGGSHDVVVKDGSYESELTNEAGYTVSKPFDEPSIVQYFCEPHRSAEMKGVVAVGEVVDDLIDPEE